MSVLKLERQLISAPAPVDYLLHRPQQCDQLVLLLHGFDDRPHRLWRTFLPLVSPTAAVLAPCGPYPLPKIEEKRIKLRFAWYFYDIFEKTYHIDQRYPCQILSGLIAALKLDHLPLLIIGHSQGGYLAPFAGLALPRTHRIIGINCEFRHQLLPDQLPFELVAVHAEDDPVVSFESSRQHHTELMAKGNRGAFIASRGGHMLSEQLVQDMQELLAP